MTVQTTGKNLRVVVANGIIMALYIALTLLVAPVASGMIQFRISESLNHLVVFNRKLMWGVFGGVIVYNLFFGFGILDVLYGGGQTFLALGLTALIQKKVKSIPLRLALNTLFFTVSMILIAFMLVPAGGAAFWTTYGWLALSEAIIMTLSAPIMYFINLGLHFEKRV
ncbi:QueT transporter family protein [Enterococcus faecalis]